MATNMKLINKTGSLSPVTNGEEVMAPKKSVNRVKEGK
jgi:hypothetical protein